MRPKKKKDQVECRIIACDRPILLKRAIKSLIAQTYPHWRAVVFDDSRIKSAKRVVENLNDKRIIYRWNKKQLGSTGNINQGFDKKALLGGAYAFILEDDNALEKSFIENGIKHLKKGIYDIVSLNQRSVALNQKGAFKRLHKLRKTPLNLEWRRENILLNAFCGESLPNGGYFWKIGTENLQVDILIREPQLQECFRQTKIKSPILLAKEIGSIWTLLPEGLIRRTPMANRKFGLTLFLFSKCLFKRYGLTQVTKWINSCKDSGKKEKAKDNLAQVAHSRTETWGMFFLKPKLFLEGIVKTCFSKIIVPQNTQTAFKRYAAKTTT